MENEESNPVPRAAVTVNEFCESVGIGRSTFYKEVGEGRIKVKKLGNRTLIKYSEIQRFMDALDDVTSRIFKDRRRK